VATVIALPGTMLASIAGAAGVAAQDDDEPTISVGSRSFAEQISFGMTLALMPEDAGCEVERSLGRRWSRRGP